MWVLNFFISLSYGVYYSDSQPETFFEIDSKAALILSSYIDLKFKRELLKNPGNLFIYDDYFLALIFKMDNFLLFMVPSIYKFG